MPPCTLVAVQLCFVLGVSHRLLLRTACTRNCATTRQPPRFADDNLNQHNLVTLRYPPLSHGYEKPVAQPCGIVRSICPASPPAAFLRTTRAPTNRFPPNSLIPRRRERYIIQLVRWHWTVARAFSTAWRQVDSILGLETERTFRNEADVGSRLSRRAPFRLIRRSSD